jgi:hypothetical protein
VSPEDLLKLRPVTFDWIDARSPRDVGLIAQEVSEVVPQAVHETDGFLKVDYARLVPHLLLWCRKLTAELQDVKARLSPARSSTDVP